MKSGAGGSPPSRRTSSGDSCPSTSKAASTTASLADGTLAVPEHGNGVPDILDEARWELEWMLKMQVPAGEPLAGMAWHKVTDRN
ncbi:glycoside hydrolase family 9 protein, partial [Microbacterium sp. B24]|uniref:glycoside hydrolase family 9 protein n=1 Tax=Microbacterium sp. B24 TaxID=95616 RepID=UPI0019553AF6